MTYGINAPRGFQPARALGGYTYTGALGFSGILAARLRGEPEPIRALAPQADPEHGSGREAPVAPGEPAAPVGAYRLEF